MASGVAEEKNTDETMDNDAVTTTCEGTENECRFESPLMENEKDGSLLALVPAGEFEMGDGVHFDCPRHRVYLDEYYIGVYAVTNRQYRKFVDETGHRAPDRAEWGSPKWKGDGCPPELSEHPVVCVDWEDAQAYCRWAGLSLPTEAQWEKTARGAEGFAYPWGDLWDSARCRHAGNRSEEGTCPVHEHADGVSGYGAYNMAGNVLEWCSDWYDPDYYKSSPSKNPTGPVKGSSRVLRGGGWINASWACRAAYRVNIPPSRRVGYYGFRAVLTPGRRP